MKHFYSTILILLISAISFGQRADIKEGDKYFAERAYLDAAEAYEKVIDKDQEILEKLGDAYFYTNQMGKAAETYRLLFLRHEEDTAPEYQFKFAHALKAVGNINEADDYMSAYTGENINTIEFEKELDTSAPHVYSTNNAINSNNSSLDFGITYYDDRVIFASTRNQERPVYPWNKKPTLDLYSAEMDENGELRNIAPFSENINTDRHESSPTFNQAGDIMYFDRTSDKKVKNEEGVRVAHIKIFRAEKIDDEWTNIEPLPFTSNEYSTEHPSLNEDGSKLYFASDMPGSVGSFDIYVVDVNEDGTYGEPENLGSGVNTEHREQFPHISKGILYFASNGHQGFGNLDIFRSEGDFSEVQNLGPTANSASDEYAFVIEAGEEKGYLVSNRNGSDNLFTFTRKDYEPPYQPPVIEEEDVEINPVTGKEQLRDVGNIYFDLDKATIRPESEESLDRVISIMNKYPDLEIEIGAHTDARGTEDYNQKLSEERAAATLEYLVDNGIERERLTSKGYGESMPLNNCTGNCTDDEYAQNRRSEFTLMND